MVVFFPSGTSATFSDPSYHLPAFYELFAQDGSQNDSARWRQVADVSRQYFVTSANANTGLHPDYANFNGTTGPAGEGLCSLQQSDSAGQNLPALRREV
jgi:oligosaccharide reducing-end xylanase